MQHKAVQLLTVISPSSDSSPSVSKPGSDAVGVEDDDGSAVEELSPRRRQSGEATSLSVSEESRPFFLGPRNSARLACLFAMINARVHTCVGPGESDGWSKKTHAQFNPLRMAGSQHEKLGGSAPPPQKVGVPKHPLPP